MALDPALAKSLFESRYKKELEAYAKKNSFMNEFKDPEDLFQDMVIEVWVKSVNLFDATKVTYVNTDPNSPDYRRSVIRAFNALFTQALKGYLSNLARRGEFSKKFQPKKYKMDENGQPVKGEDGNFIEDPKGDFIRDESGNPVAGEGSGQFKWERGFKSLDAPVGGSDDEGKETALGDTIADALADPDMKGDLRRLMNELPKDLKLPLAYILNNAEPGNINQIWSDIRKKFVDPGTGLGWTKTRFLNELYEQPAFTEWATSI